MSKWVDIFENHQFHIKWNESKKELEKIDKSEITDDNVLIELARIEKVIEYIDSYLKIVEPDLNITNFSSNLNNMQSYNENFKSEIIRFNSNKNVGHIRNANSHLDNILGQLRALTIISPKIGGQGISGMLRRYNNTLDEALKEINLNSTISDSNEIKKLKEELLVDYEDKDSIKSQISDAHKYIEEKYDKIKEYYDSTLNVTANSDTLSEKIREASEEIFENQKTAKEELTELTAKIDEFEKYYAKVFGKLEDGDRVGGLKSEIDAQVARLNKFEKDQEEKHNDILEKKLQDIKKYEKDTQAHTKNLHEQIESLLPGATSAGLAKAYQEEREKFAEPIKNWNIIFICALIVMFITSISTLNDITNIEDMGKQIFRSIPMLGPLIWLALYASKRRSENQRLEQEYAHKEALAKSYINYKNQIEGLEQEDKELLIKLLDSSIETVSKNASETLDKKHGDGLPSKDITEKIVDITKKAIGK